ncbi:WD40-repeat-containing domain protein [Amylostereum chailletii]|nr:WD40-repeat-containing domain protein [Amylostereum chailletii]
MPLSAKTSQRPQKRQKHDKTKGKTLTSAPAVSFASKGKQRAAPPPLKQPKASSKPKSEPAVDEEPSPLPTSFKVVAGSYEKLLYGFDGTYSNTPSSSSSTLEWSLNPIFIFPAHVSSVKAVAASPQGGKWLATGITDEIIKVWDLRRRREIGGLLHHEGSITHLVFPSRSHLLSASEDGTLALFRARDWSVLRTLKGHKGRVNSVAIHPSGKAGLSVGKDRTLRMWDLMRGKGSASTKLGVEGELVRWSTDGSLLVVQHQKTIDVYSTELSLLHTITHPSRVHDVKFVMRPNGEGEVLLVAGEDKKTVAYDITTEANKPPRSVASFVGHSNRVKALDTLRIALPDSKSTTILATISSDGWVHVYDISALPALSSDPKQAEIEPVAKYNTKGTRLTCVTLADGDADAGGEIAGKRKRAEDEGDDGDGEWESNVEDDDADSEEDEDEDT